MMRTGVGLALLSAVAWAFWGIFSKLSTNHHVPPGLLAFLSACTSFTVITLYFVWRQLPMAKTSPGLLFALASGLCGAIGVLLFTEAIKLGNAAIIVTLTATYPAITVLLGFVLLQETISMVNAVGLLLVTVGVVLVAR
jgi:bacterial/archaeal transporter family protein